MLYLTSELISECTVLPNFKSPHRPIVKLSSEPLNSLIVIRSVRVWVGCWCPPSPAFITGIEDLLAATIGAPSLGCLIAHISA